LYCMACMIMNIEGHTRKPIVYAYIHVREER
jgi:hypothetical protein